MTNVMRPAPEPADLRATATKLCTQYLNGLLTVADLTMGLLEASDPWTEDFIGPEEDSNEEDDPEAIWGHLFGEERRVCDNTATLLQVPTHRVRQPRRIRRLLGV